MDSYEQLASAFHRRIDCIAGAVDSLAPGLEQAAMVIVNGVMNDRKILVCARGADATLARHLEKLLRSGDNGPSLPATAIVSEGYDAGDEGLWRDLRTLSRDGDILLALDTRAGAAFALQCGQFARERNLKTIAMSEDHDGLDGHCASLKASDSTLRSELLLMAAHCLQDQIRQRLLGE